MTASESTASSPVASVTDADSVNASCRWPLLVLFSSAAGWAVLASFFQLIASIKFHSPDFLADSPWTTYGRVHDTAGSALLYGFGIQAGLGIALRICTGRATLPLARQWIVTFGATLWNLGVLVGIVGILGGDNTGYENLQLPHYAALLLFVGYLLAGVTIVFTLHGRRQPRLSSPQWFVLAAMFWFAWIFTTATGLLLFSTVRGVQQSVIDWWYSGNLTVVWLGLVGLGTGLYFLEKSRDAAGTRDYRPLFVFWTLILFGSWTGIPSSAPVPVWMPTLSMIATLALAIPLLTIAVTVYGGPPGLRRNSDSSAGSRFIQFALAAWVAATALKVISALPEAASRIDFTWFVTAQSELNTYGFYAMMMFGAIYWIVPQVTGMEWPLQKAVRVHFWLAAAGVLFIVISLAIGGVAQGVKLNHASIPFIDVTAATLPYLRVSTMGDVLIFVGHLLFLSNLLIVAGRVLRAWGTPRYRSVMMEPSAGKVGP
jgi:cytochrome c oxidase cbb3-type subunit 1